MKERRTLYQESEVKCIFNYIQYIKCILMSVLNTHLIRTAYHVKSISSSLAEFVAEVNLNCLAQLWHCAKTLRGEIK